MAENENKQNQEQKWLCGCHIVDGELVAECTQTRPQGEVSASQLAALKPYSAKCFRLAPQLVETPKPEAAVAPEASGEIGAAAPAACDAGPTQSAPVAPAPEEPTGTE